MVELPDDIHAAVTRLSEAGDELAAAGNLDAALQNYDLALELLPEPVETWSAHLWLLVAQGDALFLKGDFELGRQRFLRALTQHSEALDNPFIHLRYGQCLFELGRLGLAGEHLLLAYMGDGPEVYRDEDPKYLDHLATIATDIETP